MNTSAELKNLSLFFLNFVRSPIESVKRIPECRFRSLLLFQFLISAMFGTLTGLMSRHSWHLWVWLFTFPLITGLLSSMVSLILHFTLKFFLNHEIDFVKVYRLVLISIFPFIIFFPLLSFLPPMFLVCCALTALLLIVGLVENFKISQTAALKIVGVISAVLIALWIINQIQSQEGLGSL